MPPMPLRDLGEILPEDFILDEASVYDRGLSFPAPGERLDQMMADAALMVSAGIPFPLDFEAELESRGIIVSEYVQFIENVAETGFSIH